MRLSGAVLFYVKSLTQVQRARYLAVAATPLQLNAVVGARWG